VEPLREEGRTKEANKPEGKEASLMNEEEEQPRNEQPEERQVPVAPFAQTLSFGVGTFLAAGMVDLVAHFGPTGLVVGGIAAYVMSQHGPDLARQVREALPPPAPTAVSKQPAAAHPPLQSGRKRSLLDRALGRFPGEEGARFERVNTVIVDEPETPPETSRQTKRPVTQLAHPISLARDLTLEANEIVGAGINIFGVKGSGKTVATVRVAEQFARWRVSEVLFDLKGDAVSLVTDRRRDGRPYVPNGFVGMRGRAPRGRSILKCGLQAVYDLRTWQTPEQMASLICVIVEEMLETVALTPESDLAPCLVFLDEAEYWLPQSRPSYLSVHTYKRLLDAFHTLATMGRSRGLTPVIATQRIAKVNKDIIAQAEMNILMKAVLDIDLDRYHEYFNASLIDDEQIRGFQAGEAVVCLPDGKQLMTRFYERESRHLSHTPHITQALARFQSRAREPRAIEFGEIAQAQEEGAAWGYASTPIYHPGAEAVPSADSSPRRVTIPPHAPQPVEPQEEPLPPPHLFGTYERSHASQPAAAAYAMRPAKARLTPELERALHAWNEGATSVTKLEKALGITHHQAYKIYRQLHELRLV
jgi:hypothetical protein